MHRKPYLNKTKIGSIKGINHKNQTERKTSVLISNVIVETERGSSFITHLKIRKEKLNLDKF